MMYQLLEDEVVCVSGGETTFMQAHPEDGMEIALGVSLFAVASLIALPMLGLMSCMGVWHCTDNVCAGLTVGAIVPTAIAIPEFIGLYLLLEYLN